MPGCVYSFTLSFIFLSFLVHECARVHSANIPWASRFSLLLKPVITKFLNAKTQTWVLLSNSCSPLRTVTSGFSLSFRFSGNLIRYLSGFFQNRCLLAVLEVHTQKTARYRRQPLPPGSSESRGKTMATTQLACPWSLVLRNSVCT